MVVSPKISYPTPTTLSLRKVDAANVLCIRESLLALFSHTIPL